jgi:hypothetical protein
MIFLVHVSMITHCCTFFFDITCPMKDLRERPLHFGFCNALLGSLSISKVWSSFQREDHNKHNKFFSNGFYVIIGPICNLSKSLRALFTSPNKNKPIQKLFLHQHQKNLQRVLEIHIRLNSNVKVVECHREKMFHFSFNFHFSPINNSSKHSCIPTLNNKMWKITPSNISYLKYTIDIEN